MKKKLQFIRELIALLLILPAMALAQTGNNPFSVNGDHVAVNAPDSASGTLALVAPNASGYIAQFTGGTERSRMTGAGVLTYQASTQMAMVPYTVTMAATPVAGTNIFQNVVNVIPTAAANTAALLPTTPTAGMIKYIINTGPNAVRIKPGGTDTIQGGTAGAYIPLAALQIASCIATSTTNWGCSTHTVPTPAGP